MLKGFPLYCSDSNIAFATPWPCSKEIPAIAPRGVNSAILARFPSNESAALPKSVGEYSSKGFAIPLSLSSIKPCTPPLSLMTSTGWVFSRLSWLPASGLVSDQGD